MDYTQDINFWKRLLAFVTDVEVSDLPGEEEKEMIIYICNQKINE